jgi:hypothetical protein
MSVKSKRRIVSDASIAGPTQDSAGGARVSSDNEKANDIFANNSSISFSSIWPDGVGLYGIEDRKGDTELV